MKKIVIASLTVISMASMAEEINGYVQDHYKTVARQIPSTQQVCRDVDIPVHVDRGPRYNNQPNGGAVLLGAIVGNALGKAAGGEGAQTMGTVIGGIAGAEISRNQHHHDGGYVSESRRETRCSNVTTYTTQTEEVYSHSTMTYTDSNGRTRTIQFRR